jgi:glycosyltransferase involved in cell wall biosynthesis
MIVDTAPPQYGGAGQQALVLAEALVSRGHTVKLLARRKQDLESENEIVRFVGPYLRNESLSSAIFALLCGIRVLFTSSEVIHCHGGYYYSFFALLAATMRRKPSLLKVTLLGSDDPATVLKLKVAGVPVGLVSVRQFELADRVVALNTDVREAVLSSYPDVDVRVIANGLAMSDAVVSLNDAAPRVVFTGVLSHRKGIDSLLDSWPAFLAMYPNAILTLIGPVRDEIKSLIATLGDLSTMNITLLGAMGRPEVLKQLAAHNMFVLPSRAEGMPNSLVEAMSVGLACSVNGISVNKSTAADAAVYFDTDDCNSIVGALSEAWRGRIELGKRALSRSRAFDIEVIAETYERMYVELVQSK